MTLWWHRLARWHCPLLRMHIAPQVSDLTCECSPPLVIDLSAGKRHVTKRIALEGGHTGAISTVRVRLVC